MEFHPFSYAPDFSRLVLRGRNVFSLGDSGRWHFSFLPPNNVREMQFIDVYNVIRNGKKERNFDLQGILLLAVFDRRLGAIGIFRIIVWHLQKSPFYDEITFSIINTIFLIHDDISCFQEKNTYSCSCFNFLVVCFYVKYLFNMHSLP